MLRGAFIFGSSFQCELVRLGRILLSHSISQIAAALWAFEPSAIAFSRLAKEDIFFLFFFLLANFFWLRGQSVAEGEPERNPQPYYWATGAAFGAMLASKYVPHFIAISVSYNYTFQKLPGRRWVIGKKRYLIFFAIMGATFLLCNPTILLPATWREMFAFASYQRMGHDSYEFMGRLYPHRIMDWLAGIPWYFYLVFIGVKTAIPTLVAFLVGLPLLFRRRLGDGRFFLFFWVLFGFIPFCLLGGKFTRYLTTSLPVVFITAAIGIQFVNRWFVRQLNVQSAHRLAQSFVKPTIVSLVLLSSVWASVSAAPHYRLYTNLIGGSVARSGYYFPQDDFYDASIRPIMFEIARRAQPGARVASETPSLVEYYAKQANRDDLRAVSLSDPAALAELESGDFILAARGRRYFSNEHLLSKLQQSTRPAFQVDVGEVSAAEVYLLDQTSLPIVTNGR